MKEHKLKWLIETNISFQSYYYNDEIRLDQNEFILVPTPDGKIFLYSPTEGGEVKKLEPILIL